MNIKILFIILCVSLQSYAQKTTFHVRSGLHISHLTNIDGTIKAGYQAGIVCAYPLTDALYLQPELSFSSQGGKVQTSDPRLPSLTLRCNYINMPLLFKWRKRELFVLSGFQIGTLFSATEINEETRAKMDATSKFKSIDISIPAGIGAHFEDRWIFEFRYNAGINNILTIPGADEAAVSNHVMQLSFSYRLSK